MSTGSDFGDDGQGAVRRSASVAADGAGLEVSDSLRSAAREAWLYTLPLMEVAALRSRSIALGARLNWFRHARHLADHRSRAAPAPNNDTLYSSAHIDLTGGPVAITLPELGSRYLSLQLMDAFTNTIAVLGSRTTGSECLTFQLVGPDDAAPPGPCIRSPTRHVWALARVLVDGPADLDAARAVQDQLSIGASPAVDAPTRSSRQAPWQDYFAAADQLLTTDRPPLSDLTLFQRISPLGLGEGRFNAADFSSGEVAEIEAGVSEAKSLVKRAHPSAVIDGWTYPHPEVGDFRQNYHLRASTAVRGLAALPTSEAMVMFAAAPPGEVLDGCKPWRLSFARDAAPPTHAFWSLSVYEITPDGQLFFADNAIGRFSIGNRTSGLRTSGDGSLNIWIGHEPPDVALQSNWLPTPPGPFSLALRAYLPQRSMIEGGWLAPPLTPA